VADRAEERTQLQRDRNRHAVLDEVQDLQVALLDRLAGYREIGLDRVDVEFQPFRAGLLELLRIVDPALAGHTVQTGDHRNVDRFGGAPDQVQIAVRPRRPIVDLREVAQRFGEAQRAVFPKMIERVALLTDLFLEQREHHHGRGAAVLQLSDAVE